MARIITKGLIGQQDISIGTSTFTRATSTGGTQTLNQVPIFQTGLVVASRTSSTVYTISPSPSITSLFVMVFVNGLLQNPGALNDYTISGSTITFNNAVSINSVVLAVY